MKIKVAGREYDGEAGLRERLRELDEQYPEQRFPDDVRDEWNAVCAAVSEFDARRERLGQMAGSPSHREQIDGGTSREDQPRSATREAGLRAVERHRDQLGSEAGDRLDQLAGLTGTSAIRLGEWQGNCLVQRGVKRQ